MLSRYIGTRVEVWTSSKSAKVIEIGTKLWIRIEIDK